MMEHGDERLSFPGMLEPLLTAPDGDEAAFDQAINDVAEALADSGTLVLDATGRPAQGATDEDAVLGVLDTYVRVLLHLGEVEEASGMGELIDRVQRVNHRRKRRGSPAA